MAIKMKHKKRGSTMTLVLMLVALVALTAVVVFWPVDSTASATEQDDVEATTLIHVGDVAPDFTVEMFDGSRVTLSELRGKPVLLIFWATWCPPCRAEMAHLQQGVIDVYGDRITVLPISRGEERSTVENFLQRMGYTFLVGLDPEQEVYRKYATNYIPRCLVIGSDGVVDYVGVGYDETVAEEVRQALNAAL